jgi:hypothetical protein
MIKKENLVMSPKGVPDTKKDRPTDRRSQHLLNYTYGSNIRSTLIYEKSIRNEIQCVFQETTFD